MYPIKALIEKHIRKNKISINCAVMQNLLYFVHSLEKSHSGLVRHLGKVVCLNGHQEFESPLLRRVELARVPRGSRALEVL